MTMPYGISFGIDLSLIEMPFSIPFSGKVVLVLAPGYSGHEINFVSSFFPGCDSLFQGFLSTPLVRRISADAVHHHGISPVVNFRHPAA